MNFKLLKLFSLIISLAVLCSCSLFSPVKENAVTLYEIKKTPRIVVHKKKRAGTILVLLPETTPAYNTTAMVYRTKPYQLAYFAQNRWAETPAQMLQHLLVQTLLTSNHFRAVITPPFIGNYDYILYTQILELQQDYTHRPPVARFKLRAILTRRSNNVIVASSQFNVQMPFYCKTPYNGVIAANRAVEKAVAQVTNFVVRHS